MKRRRARIYCKKCSKTRSMILIGERWKCLQCNTMYESADENYVHKINMVVAEDENN